MFGFLALGFFACLASKGGQGGGGGILGGIAATLLAIKGIKETLKELGWIKSKEDKDKEAKNKEFKELLKKKPEDLTQKEKARLEELGADPDIDIESLTDKGLANYKRATGKSLKDTQDEADEENKNADEINKNKALALLQQEVESKEDDTSEEANNLREAYDGFIKCAYDEDGNPRSAEDFDAEFKKLPKDLQDKINDNVKAASKDEKVIKELQEKAKNVTAEQAAAAVEKAKAKRAEISKKDELAALEEKYKEDIKGKSEDEVKSITEAYEKEKKATSDKWDAKIKQHNDAAAKADSGESLRQKKTAANTAKKTKKELEEKKAALDSEEAKEETAKKYANAFKDSPYEPGDLKGDKAKEAKKYFEEKGYDVELLNKIHTEFPQSADKEPNLKAIVGNEDIAKGIDKDIEKQKAEIDKKIKDQQKVIDDYENAKSEVEKANTGATGATGETGKTGETGATGETGTISNSGGKSRNKKLVNPAKIWKRKKRKDGKGQTKSYYNKNGASISATLFKEKMAAYKKALEKHKKGKFESLTDYVSAMLEIEQNEFIPLVESEQLDSLTLVEYLKNQIEVKD